MKVISPVNSMACPPNAGIMPFHLARAEFGDSLTLRTGWLNLNFHSLTNPCAKLLLCPVFLFIGMLPGTAGPISTDKVIENRPNVLFIAVDDLRPELNCYGAPVYSPNIDRLASGGLTFDRHYVQVAVCIPSRASLLTGLRPERTRQTYGPSVWPDVPGVGSWGTTFSDAGYATVSLGKIWHTIGRNPDRFDVVYDPGLGYTYADPRNNALYEEYRAQRRAGIHEPDIPNPPPITEMADAPDEAYADGKTAARAVEELRRLAQGGQPFMLAVGFVRPHLPFASPKKYWELYDEKTIELAGNPHVPAGMPKVAFNNNPNFLSYSYGDYPPFEPGKPMPERTARHLRHAYRASTSFIDAQVGKLLTELDQSGLASNTIVMFWGDHGFFLGETGQWSKHSNFEWATRSPLIIRYPGVVQPALRTGALVETVDIFPTLLQLCRIPTPEVCDGRSMVPLLHDPAQPWKEGAHHLYNRHPMIGDQRELVIGHAVRTRDFRYVSWRMGWTLDGEEIARELYDYRTLPVETRNLADDPEYAGIRDDLIKLLESGPASSPYAVSHDLSSPSAN